MKKKNNKKGEKEREEREEKERKHKREEHEKEAVNYRLITQMIETLTHTTLK
jgi:hypothetical protein